MPDDNLVTSPSNTRTMTVGRELTVPAAKAWAVIGDWSWWAFGAVDRDPTNPKRRVLAAGRIVEELQSHDPNLRRFSYSMPTSPWALTSYLGTVTVSESGLGLCRVTYEAVYEPDGTLDPEAFETSFRASLEQGLDRLVEATSLHGELDFVIGAPLDRLWSRISNWHDVSWVMRVRRAEMLSATKRRMIFEGGHVVESELVGDPSPNRIAYEMTKTPLPLSYYSATLTLEPISPTHTRWNYRFSYAAKSGTPSAVARAAVEGGLAARRAWLQEKFETRHVPPPAAHAAKEALLVLRYWYLAALARLNRKVLWPAFSRLPVPAAVDLAGRPSLPQDDAAPGDRLRALEAARDSLDVRPLYEGRAFRTRKSVRLPRAERFPAWWKSDLILFQLQVRALLGKTSEMSMSPLRVRHRRLIDAIWSFLPDDGYNTTSFEDDVTFGQLFVASTGATLVRRCTEVPERLLPRSIQRLDGSADDPSPARLDTQALWFVDFDALEGLPDTPEDVPAPLVLLRENADGRPVPVLIQLNGEAYLPVDGDDWLVAKMWTAKAYVAMVRTVHHGLFSHFSWAGAVAIATIGQLSERHPMHRLLAPFTRYTIEINQLAEQLIVNPTGALAGQVMGFEGSVELMRRMEERMSFDDLHLPSDLARRGVGQGPARYPYREDGKALWDAIFEMVSARVALWYRTPESVTLDAEIQAWAYELSRGIDGFPCPIADTTQLSDAVTASIYSVILHQLHNAPAADHTIVPDRLASLASTIRGVAQPRFRGDGPKELWRHAGLGNVIVTLLFDATLTAYNRRITFAHELERYVDDSDARSAGELAAIARFRDACDRISSRIRAENDAGMRPLRFDHLAPARCSQSVSS